MARPRSFYEAAKIAKLSISKVAEIGVFRYDCSVIREFIESGLECHLYEPVPAFCDKIEEELGSAGNPNDVGARHMGNLVMRRPLPGDDRILRVFDPRTGKRIRMGETNSTRRIVRRVIHVVFPEGMIDQARDFDHAGEDDVVAGIVAQLFRRKDDALVGKDRNVGGHAGL